MIAINILLKCPHLWNFFSANEDNSEKTPAGRLYYFQNTCELKWVRHLGQKYTIIRDFLLVVSTALVFNVACVQTSIFPGKQDVCTQAFNVEYVKYLWDGGMGGKEGGERLGIKTPSVKYSVLAQCFSCFFVCFCFYRLLAVIGHCWLIC